MTMGHWILDKNKRAIHVDLQTWARWFQDHTKERIVKQEDVRDLWVSTVFLGLDQNFNTEGKPILWETRVFRRIPHEHGLENLDDIDMDRCSGNWEQAEAMHNEMVERVKAMA